MTGKVRDGSSGYTSANSYHLHKSADRRPQPCLPQRSDPPPLPPAVRRGADPQSRGRESHADADATPAAAVLPLPLQSSLEDFCQYVELCFLEFGDGMKHWIKLNDPRSYCIGGYVTGILAPGRGCCSRNPRHDFKSQGAVNSFFGYEVVFASLLMLAGAI
ncbi:hypothetical protein RJ640_015561 [Escallonia rubra]|uniref:Uncharacterized protein n=1 Tax=Escallonia rubra TaxID=112253 RepID=A0AA88UAE2_9ASTE|nr:hypothetical protein RJ640_015561 [Escallonia rubra]